LIENKAHLPLKVNTTADITACRINEDVVYKRNETKRSTIWFENRYL